MAVTIYRSTDAGAPALPANSNYVKASFFMDIVKQCLVTGYGSKAGAGWSLVYESTTANKRRLAVSNGNGVMEFITWGTVSVAMVMWDSITTPGSGRLYDDSFATVMSTGVNGWKSPLVSAPGVVGENIYALNLNSVHTGFASAIAWTVFADEKSAWILFHYPSGNTSAEGTDALSTSGTQHPQLFIGALKSPDLERSQAGNFFGMLPTQSLASNPNSTATTNINSLSLFWGLRTPQNTIPSVANNSSFDHSSWDDLSRSALNPYSSVRVLIAVGFSYLGIDVVKPSSLTGSGARYLFATIPGLAQFGTAGTGSSGFHYWGYLNTERGATWNLQPYTVNGVEWMPWTLSGGANANGNLGITNDSSWWA
ncbi:MAG TPA: hypothetical protein VLE50_01610 [Cellvibrio sp.]|nr:hypothetical protein [Cellvibrio sp.]